MNVKAIYFYQFVQINVLPNNICYIQINISDQYVLNRSFKEKIFI